MDVKEKKINTTPQRHPWEKVRAKIVLTLLQKVFSSPTNKTVSVLDIGCGDGYVLSELSKKYPDSHLTGIDTALDDAMINSMNGPNVTFFKTIEAARDCLKTPFSVVLLMDVLEHLYDQDAFFDELTRCKQISGSTTFFITVPAFQSLFSSHDRFLGHVRRYTRKSLVEVLKRNGLSVDQSGYLFSTLLLPRGCKVLFEHFVPSFKKNTSDLVEWSKGTFTTAIIEAMLIADFKLSIFLKRLGIIMPGLSSYALCKKHVS